MLKSDYIKAIHQKLDTLLQAYESKGILVNQQLSPAMTEQDLKAQCGWFPETLPIEIIALYTWRGGQDTQWVTQPFWFRDTIFCDLKIAKENYQRIVVPYAEDGEEDPDLGWEYLRQAFPFSSFDGAVYVIPSQNYVADERLARPIISVHEGVQAVFESLETMLDTCIEWVENGTYNEEDEFLEINNEREIWVKHNSTFF